MTGASVSGISSSSSTNMAPLALRLSTGGLEASGHVGVRLGVGRKLTLLDQLVKGLRRRDEIEPVALVHGGALHDRPAAVSSLKPIEEAGVGRQVGQYAADRLAHQDNDAGLGERAIARNAHAGGKNLMLGTLSGLEALPAVGAKLAKAAAEPGDRNLALRHEGCEQLRPLSLIAIKAPPLDQLGAGVFVVCIHRSTPHSAPVLRRGRMRPSRRTAAQPVSMRRAL